MAPRSSAASASSARPRSRPLAPRALGRHRVPGPAGGRGDSACGAGVRVADVLDALTSDRPYRPASPLASAREIINAESGTHFDPRVVEAFNGIADEDLRPDSGRDPMSRGVLVVDDDPFIRKLIATTLEDVADFDLHEAADGAQALEVARRERPTLVFLDVDMPVLDGIDACRQLRCRGATGHATIVMLTAAHGDSVERSSEDAGADLFLTKPFSPLDLLRLVDQLGEQA